MRIVSAKLCVKLILTITVLLCYFAASVYSEVFPESEKSDEFVPEDDFSGKVLSRKRRYLIFPQGSSLQLVYDQIIGIVDFTNLFIMGITIAFAWELPSKTPTELIDQLKDTLNEGLVRKDEDVSKLNYTDGFKPKPIDPYLDRYYYNQYKYSEAGMANSNRRNFYDGYSSDANRRYDGVPYYAKNRGFSNRYNYANNIRKNPHWNSGRNGYRRIHPTRKHRIYPVFRKRSLDDDYQPNLDEQLHLRYHRSTRHDLYKRIELYLESHGKNGSECVLKALCETGKKQEEEEPSTFVGEIMRAIFTIPEPLEDTNNLKHRGYDDAHFSDGNCDELYPKCPESLWEAHFIF